MKRQILLLAFLIAVLPFAEGQDLLIRYDFVNRNISYYKVKKYKSGGQKLIPKSRPRIRANKNVKVEYVNINPFIWNQPKVNITTSNQDSVASYNPFAMLLPNNIFDRFGSMGFGGTRDASTLDPQQRTCMSSLESLYETYDQINQLKYDHKLTKQQILDQSHAKLRRLVRSCSSSVKLDTATPDYRKGDFDILKSYFRDICHMDNIPGLRRSGGESKVNDFLATSGVNANQDVVLPTEAMSDIENNYFTMNAADFSFENSFIVSDKDVVLRMGFSLTDEYRKKTGKDSVLVEKGSKHPSVKDESVYIPVAGGVRISNSAGIGFTYLGKERKSYFLLNDSILTAAPDNRVVPVIGSFLNAYSRGLGAVNIGGSFGIGISLEETLSINYMLGATVVIGKKERILLSAGMVLAPVSEPSKGYHEKMVTYNPDFPTKLNYKPGIFFCIHYNVGKF